MLSGNRLFCWELNMRSTDQAACSTAAPLKICLCQPWEVNPTMNTVSVRSRVVLQQSKPKQRLTGAKCGTWQLLDGLSITGQPSVERRRVGAAAGSFLETPSTAAVTHRPLRPRRPAAVHCGNRGRRSAHESIQTTSYSIFIETFPHFLLVHILLLVTDCRKASATTLEMCLRLFSCEKTDQESISLSCLLRSDWYIEIALHIMRLCGYRCH